MSLSLSSFHSLFFLTFSNSPLFNCLSLSLAALTVSLLCLFYVSLSCTFLTLFLSLSLRLCLSVSLSASLPVLTLWEQEVKHSWSEALMLSGFAVRKPVWCYLHWCGMGAGQPGVSSEIMMNRPTCSSSNGHEGSCGRMMKNDPSSFILVTQSQC